MQEIFGIKLDKILYKDLFEEITKFEKQTIVFTPNPEILLKVKKDQEFRNILNEANYLTPDGIGLFVAFQILEDKNKFISFLKIPYYVFNLFFRRKYLYEKYSDRICGSDLTMDLLEFSQKNNIKITILDLYNPNDLKKLESQKVFPSKLKQKFPKLELDYFVYNTEKKLEIFEEIKKSSSKIVFSTLGMKIQEISVLEVIKNCKNIKLGLGVGSSFDYITGFQKRAPKIFRILGLEWLYRLLTGPKKLNRLKRLYNAIFVFLYEVFKN